MKSFENPADKDEILRRLETHRLDAPRQWGKMTAAQMMCHLNDSFETVMGMRHSDSVDSLLARTVIRWIALHTSMKWPQGAKTMPQNDQQIGGTPPAEFEQDRAKLRALIEQFVQAVEGGKMQPHPYFGALSRAEWLLWGYRHCDHHFRQFGI